MLNRCLLVAGLATLVLVVLFAFSQIRFVGGMISQEYVLDDDARQHFTPFMAARHPEAFKDRFVLDYSDAYLPRGYRRLMMFISRYADPLTGGKYLGLSLMLFTIPLAMLAGGSVGGVAGAAVALAMATRSDVFTCHVYAGLFRSFAVPMALLHMYLLFSRRYIGAAFSLLVQALFYPPLSIINIPVTVVMFLPRLRREKNRLLREALPFAIVILMALAALYMYSARSADYGAPIRLADAELMCEWYYPGRLRELPLQPVDEVLGFSWKAGVSHSSRGAVLLPALLQESFWHDYALPAVMLILLAVAVAWNRYAAAVLVAMAASGFALYLLACNQAFILGYPERYLYYSLPFTTMLLWPVAWGAARRRWKTRVLPRVLVCLLGGIVWFSYSWQLPLLRDVAICREHHQNLYAALDRIEGDVLITAWTPNVLDDIPLMIGREVLFNIENAHPVYMPYYREVRNRILDTVTLAFSTNVHEAVKIRDRYGITHLVLENRLAELGRRKPPMFMPFYQVGDLMRRRVPMEDMIFYKAPLDWVFYGDDEFTVFDLGKLPEPAVDEIIETSTMELPPAWCRYPSDIELINMRILPESIRTDGTFVMEYTWRVPIYTVSRPYRVFVHFMRDGELIFTGDHMWITTLDYTKVNWRADAPVTLTYLHEHRAPSSEEVIDDVMIGLINRRTGKRIMPVAPNEHINGAVSVPLRY